MLLKHLILLLAFLLGISLVHAQNKSWKPISKNEMPPGTERRLALVIGNKDYVRADARLRNPVNDATDMTAALESLGFDVITYNNLNLAGFKKAVDEFGTRLSGYNVALFYYSGHALQFNGENYLVPVDATLQTLSDAEDDCLRLGRVMGKMKAVNVKNNIVFLDACRNNPFPKNDGSKAKPAAGLIIPNNPAGTMVVFATEEGSTADDNINERNGLFTAELLKHLTIPNLSIGDIVLNTRQGVYKRSGERQLPADYNKMLGQFYFVKKDIKAEAPTPKSEEPVRTEPPATATTKSFLDLPFADMAYIEGGTFQMGDTQGEGDPDEKPVHKVTVSSFLMGKYEITQRQWQEIMGNNPSRFNGCDDCPVEKVSWDDVQEFLKKLNTRTGGKYRLPTEAEWEYAAGGGDSGRTRFANGKDVLTPSEANFDASEKYKTTYSEIGEYRGKPTKVGSFPKNRLGLYDVTGNVWEWCSDWYGAYSITAVTNPKGPSTGSHRVLRGGSWNYNPQDNRVANRNGFTPSSGYGNVGFRVVVSQ